MAAVCKTVVYLATNRMRMIDMGVLRNERV